MYKHLFKILPLFLAMAFASCNNDKLTEIVVAKFDNGQPSKVHYYDKSHQVVREVDYYESGALMMEGPMENNLRNGEWTSYFPDGKVQSTGVFKDGLRTGKAMIYHENGNLYYDGYYKDGSKCGLWICYDEQGYEMSRADYGPCD